MGDDLVAGAEDADDGLLVHGDFCFAHGSEQAEFTSYGRDLVALVQDKLALLDVTADFPDVFVWLDLVCEDLYFLLFFTVSCHALQHCIFHHHHGCCSRRQWCAGCDPGYLARFQRRYFARASMRD